MSILMQLEERENPKHLAQIKCSGESNGKNTTEKKGKICIHHWILPPPSGPTCIGECKFCGEKKEFFNTLDSGGWKDQKDNSYNRQRKRKKKEL